MVSISSSEIGCLLAIVVVLTGVFGLVGCGTRPAEIDSGSVVDSGVRPGIEDDDEAVADAEVVVDAAEVNEGESEELRYLGTMSG